MRVRFHVINSLITGVTYMREVKMSCMSDIQIMGITGSYDLIKQYNGYATTTYIA